MSQLFSGKDKAHRFSEGLQKVKKTEDWNRRWDKIRECHHRVDNGGHRDFFLANMYRNGKIKRTGRMAKKRSPLASNLGIDFGINLQCAWGRLGTFSFSLIFRWNKVSYFDQICCIFHNIYLLLYQILTLNRYL